MYSSFSVGKNEEIIERAQVELRPAPTPPIIYARKLSPMNKYRLFTNIKKPKISS